MAWLGEGLSSLRGQITSFTKEVLSEGREEERGHELQLQDAEEKIRQLEGLCTDKDLEISKLREINALLETQANQQQYEHRKQQQQPLLYNVGSSSNQGEFQCVYSFEDPGNAQKEAAYDFSSMETEKDDLVDYLRAEIRALKIEKEKVEKKLELFQKECACSDINPASPKLDSMKDGTTTHGLKSADIFATKNQQPENIIDGLETELLVPCLESNEHNSDSQMESPEFNDVSEESSQSLVNAKGLQKAQLIRAHQDMVNRIIQRGDKSFDGDVSLKKYHMEKQHPVQFINIIKNLDDPDQQNAIVQGSTSNSENRVNVSDDISYLHNVADIESANKNWMNEDTRGECDGSEEMSKDMVKLVDQISKLTVSLSDAQLNMNQFQEKEEQLVKEIDRMTDQEFQAEESLINLKAQLDAAQESNNQLEQKLEELDKQHSIAIEQLISVKSSLQHKNEALQSQVKELEQKVLTLESRFGSCSSDSNIADASVSAVRREIELEMEKEVLKFIPPELIPREPKSNNSGKVSVVVGAVKGLAKLCEEHRWKKETIERKMAEMMKEAREVKAECLQLRGEIVRRDNSSGLRTEGLEPILETGEEEDEDDDVINLPTKDSMQNASIKAAMENELFVSNGDKLSLQKRCLALEEEVKRLRANNEREHKESDLFDEEDEDDADGTEEVNDWTWQANLDQKKSEMLVEDNGLIKNDIVEVSPNIEWSCLLQDDVGTFVSTKPDMPTLTEQYLKEKSKLEKLIEELQQQQKILEVEKESAAESIVDLEDTIKLLNEDLETKTKLSTVHGDNVKKLEEKVAAFETERGFFEKLIAEKDSEVKELGSKVASLNMEFENERRKKDEMRKIILELNRQIAQLEGQLKDTEESLMKHSENVKFLEDQNIFLEQSMKNEDEIKEEQYSFINQLQEKMKTLQVELAKETKLKDEALKGAKEANEKSYDLDLKLNYEIQLKDEALNKLTDVEDRFRIVEESINYEMKSKNEFTDRILDLERKLRAVQEESTLDRSLKDEAVLRASEQECFIVALQNELSIAKQKLQEREQSVLDYQNKLTALEMERERIMCVVGDKAREISSLRSERQRLMEAMSMMEKMRQKEIVSGDPALLLGVGNEVGNLKDGNDQTETPPGEREGMELEDDGTLQLLAKLKNLQLESEQLAESYRQEQQRSKHLQNEVHEMMEKEANMQDELKRLRQHLVSVEDRYTKEAVNAQERIALLKNKLTQVEERLHASSSAYTSASVRSNQQVESLENQVRALTVKKDESKSRLLAAEEQLAQQAKDLTNLQTVLEQFQKDKEREISVVKDKMGTEISSLENKCEELSEEITNLKEQLQQAKEGLSAAARLSEQVDKKSEIIASLKAELKKLNANVISAEERLQSASLNIEGKVEKNLVKNLLLGYLSAPLQGPRRAEILRIIATILEFSKEEKERVDLGDGSGKSMGWLRGMAGWGGQHKDGSPAGDLNQPSLSEAFIRFLESESRPKSQLRMLSDSRIEPNRSSSPASGQPSTPSSSSTPPLLMSETILPTLPTFSVASGSNSSCILKDVLKDS